MGIAAGARDGMMMAYEFAQAVGETVIVGARPYDKGWFAHVDGIEVDGSSPFTAVKGVIQQWKQRAEQQARDAEGKAKGLRDRLTRLEA